MPWHLMYSCIPSPVLKTYSLPFMLLHRVYSYYVPSFYSILSSIKRKKNVLMKRAASFHLSFLYMQQNRIHHYTIHKVVNIHTSKYSMKNVCTSKILLPTFNTGFSTTQYPFRILHTWIQKVIVYQKLVLNVKFIYLWRSNTNNHQNCSKKDNKNVFKG